MNQNIKNFIEEGEKEFDYRFNLDVRPERFDELPSQKEVKQFISSRQISLIKMIVEMVEERINISNLLIEASEDKDNFLKDDGFTNKERISSEIAIKVAFESFKNDIDTLVP